MINGLAVLIFEPSGTIGHDALLQENFKIAPHVRRQIAKQMVQTIALTLTCPCVDLICGQRFVLGDWQKTHVLRQHCGVYAGMTWSPTATECTPSPTDSTIQPASCPKMEGNNPSGSNPSSV